MANTISLKDLQIVNKLFEQRNFDITNVGISPRNLLLGRYINVPNNFQGIVIGDFIQPTEDGIYIGKNVKITSEGIIFKTAVIDAGADKVMDLNRTNPIDIMDGVQSEAIINLVLPVDPIHNWGRPIVDAGVV